jgi:membrane-bound serine protease (ClpP class)
MMPFLLVLLGLVLIFIEFFVPGAVMGTLGSIAVLIGIVLFASESSSLLATVLFVAGTAAAIGLLIRFALWRIVHTKSSYSIYSDKDQQGYQASSYDQSAIGKSGTVLADLKPGGFVLIEGKQHPAISVSGYLSKGDKVTVIGGQEQSLIVKKEIEKEPST